MTTISPEGRVLGGRYRLVRQIGTGGMAVVFEAVDEVIGRRVAVKVFTASAAAPEALQAHQQEARTSASLNHPNLVTLLDAGVHLADDEPRVYLVLELIDGSDLKQRLRHGPLALRHVAHLGFDLADALAHLHRAGLVHRDVKPANVLLVSGSEDRRPRAKLGDFGIAIPVIGQIVDPELTTGTAAYLSPEQVDGGAAGPEGDVYSLGLVLLEALTARVVFPGDVLTSALARLDADPVVPDSVPAAWRTLLQRMTARGAADRPTAEEVAEHFTRFVIDSDLRPETPAPEADEDARLRVLARYDLLDTPPEGAFDRITALASRTLGVPVSTVSIVDRDRIWFKSHHGIDAEQVGRDAGLCASVVESGRIRRIADTLADASTRDNPLVTGPTAFRAYLGVPLVSSDGYTLGALSVLDRTPREFTADEVDILESLGAMVAHELEVRRATQRIRSPAA